MLQKIVWQTRKEHLEYMVRDGHKLIHETHHDILNIPAKRKTLHKSVLLTQYIQLSFQLFYIKHIWESSSFQQGVLSFMTTSPWKSQMCAVRSRKATVATTDYFRMPKCWEMPKKKQFLYSHITSILFFNAGKAEYPTSTLSEKT